MTQRAKVVQDKFNKTAYYKAQGYAYKLTPKDYVDIVHDSYIVWFNKTKNNLFNEHQGTIARVLRNVFYNKLSKGQYMKNGVIHLKTYVSKDDILDGSPRYNFEDWHNPVKELVYKELSDQLENKLNGSEKKVCGYLREGYKQVEIAKELKVSANNVNIRTKSIHKKLQELIK